MFYNKTKWISIKDQLPRSKKRVFYLQKFKLKNNVNGSHKYEIGIGSYSKSIKQGSQWCAWYAGLKCWMSGQKKVTHWAKITEEINIMNYPAWWYTDKE